MELGRGSLKGLAKLTKKGELQSRIDRKNEEIDLLKVGLSGIVKRYGFQTVTELSKGKCRQTNKTDFKKQKQRGKMTCPSKILLRYFWLVKTLHLFYNAAILDLIFVMYDIAVTSRNNKKQRRFKK